MAEWIAFEQTGNFTLDVKSVRANWARLHRGDGEPLPDDPAVLEAWVAFHQGRFRLARDAGLLAGVDGITVANKATSVYANSLELKEKVRLELFLEVAHRAEAQQQQQPLNPNAWYWQAYALGRYSQGISVAKALAQGLGAKVKGALEHTLSLSPSHADAHLALAAFHAEVIDKVGPLIAGLTYGAKKETALALFRRGLQLQPDSAIAMIEYANGLVMLQGDKALGDANQLYEEAARSQPMDAAETLNVDLAREELQD